MREEVRERLTKFLKEKGLRRTSQRDAIVEAAFNTTEHYTADDLLEMAKKVDKSVSRATVYRTLPLMVESGLLREMDFGKDQKYYDPNFLEHPHHNHIICTDCDKIFEFEDQHIDLLEDCITRRLGFTPSSKAVQIQASCEVLKSKGICTHQEEEGSEPVKR